MSFETKFENFLKEVAKSPYDLPSELNPFFKSALQSAGFDQVQTTSGTASVASGATKVRKMSGYNLYMKEKMAELKAQNVPSTERMGKVSGMWKLLGDAEKATYKTKAEGQNTAASATGNVAVKAPKAKKTGPTKLSGYQFYVKEKMPELKTDASIPAKERMSKIGAIWKALSDTEKAGYKVKAEATHGTTPAPAQTGAGAQTTAPASDDGDVDDQVENDEVEEADEPTPAPVQVSAPVKVSVPTPAPTPAKIHFFVFIQSNEPFTRV